MSTQIERLASLENKVDNIDRKLDELIGGLDRKYASKMVEKIVYAMVGIILMAVVLGLLGLLGLSLHPSVVTQTTTTPGSTSTTTSTPGTPGATGEGRTTVSQTTTPPSSSTSTNSTPASPSILDGLGRLLK